MTANADLISRSALHAAICLNAKYGTYGEFTDGSEVCFTSKEVHSMIDEAPAVDAGPKWISVEERLPEHGDEVLVVLEVYSLFGKTKTCIATAIFTPPKWWAIADYDTGFVTATDETDVEVNRHRITHWMPLPEPPEKG